LLGKGTDADFAAIVANILLENNAQLIGATPEDLARVLKRAIV